MPGELDDMLADPAFWASYLLDDEFEGDRGRYEGTEELTVWFPVTARHELKLDIAEGFWSHELGLVTAGSPGESQLGWDDGAHFHPHVFRWEEFDLVCRAMALRDQALRYPGPAGALLCRFAFLSEEENLDEVTPVVDACLHSTRPSSLGARGYWPSTEDWLDLKDLRNSRVSWSRDGDGIWTASQADDRLYQELPIYTLRWDSAREEGIFPFQEWKTMLDDAERSLAASVDPAWAGSPETVDRIGDLVAGELGQGTAVAALAARAGCANPVVLRALSDPVHPVETMWVLELLTAARRGSLIGEHFGRSPLRTDPVTELRLRLTVESDEEIFLPPVVDEIEEELRQRGLGSALGYLARVEGGVQKATVTVTLRGSREEGERAVGEVLQRHELPRWELS